MEPRFRIENVSFPPHYLDKPGDTPKCKGYALVTFSTKSHLEAVLRAWPWKRCRALVPANENGDGNGGASLVVKEAHKYGLRAISKARWDALNEEYLLYKQYLVDEMARTQSEVRHPGEDATEHKRGGPTTFPQPHSQNKTQTQIQTTPSSPYPLNCLVFVRNVNPETNKTTLKSLFAQAFQDGSSLDYVDFNKGMDTVRVRLHAVFCRTLKRVSLSLYTHVYASVTFVSHHRITRRG